MDDYLAERLEQIRWAARNACDYSDGMAIEEFIADLRTQQACALNLIIIGEAAKRILERYPDMPAQHPTVPWRYMAAMRNHIAHEYEKLNFNIVFDTVAQDLPELIVQIDLLLSR